MGDKSHKSIEWVIALTKQDLVLIDRALNEILHGRGAIDDSEFELRTGVDRRHGLDLRKRIGERLEEISGREQGGLRNLLTRVSTLFTRR